MIILQFIFGSGLIIYFIASMIDVCRKEDYSIGNKISDLFFNICAIGFILSYLCQLLISR